MGFTIEDMMVISKDKYKMKLVAGKNGWSNSIKWIFVFENTTILEHFSGKEMGVTTGLGFQTEPELLNLADRCAEKHCSGLLINTGYYIHEVPESVVRRCDEADLPLLTVPWEVNITDMIKDLTLRMFQQDRADEQISGALIRAIEEPEARDHYETDLLPYFDVDGNFQTILISNGALDSMDTVERRRLSYQLQIYLEKITHNGNFFYYNSYFVLMVNDVPPAEIDEIVTGFLHNCNIRMPEHKIYVAVGSPVKEVTNLALSFHRAEAAMDLAFAHGQQLVYFDRMGISRLLYSIQDAPLVRELGADLLAPLIEYDSKKGTDYVNTLKLFLEYNGSIQTVAQLTYTHKNTVIYHLNNIRKLLGTDLSSPDQRLQYLIACLIYTR